MGLLKGRQAEAVGLVVVIVAIVMGIVGWLVLCEKPNLHIHQQIRQRVEDVSDIKELQKWAQKVLKGGEKDIPNNGAGWLSESDMSDLPLFVRKIKPKMVLVAGRHTSQAHLVFVWRDKYGSCGLMVGSPQFTASSVKIMGITYEAKLWRPGVYTWVQK
jgi:hypothetical protein